MQEEDAWELAARFLAGILDPEENARFVEEARAPGPLRRALTDALADLGIEQLREGLGGEEN